MQTYKQPTYAQTIALKKDDFYCRAFYSLSDLLLRAIPSWVVHALREVLDESDALRNADLLLLCQLGGQSGLAGCRVVDRHMDLLLKIDREEMTLKKKQLSFELSL